MRPSDHLLVLWQWNTAVSATRDAIRTARSMPTRVWCHRVIEAQWADIAAREALRSYTGTAVVSPAETGKGE